MSEVKETNREFVDKFTSDLCVFNWHTVTVAAPDKLKKICSHIVVSVDSALINPARKHWQGWHDFVNKNREEERKKNPGN